MPAEATRRGDQFSGQDGQAKAIRSVLEAKSQFRGQALREVLLLQEQLRRERRIELQREAKRKAKGS